MGGTPLGDRVTAHSRGDRKWHFATAHSKDVTEVSRVTAYCKGVSSEIVEGWRIGNRRRAEAAGRERRCEAPTNTREYSLSGYRMSIVISSIQGIVVKGQQIVMSGECTKNGTGALTQRAQRFGDHREEKRIRTDSNPVPRSADEWDVPPAKKGHANHSMA